MKPNEVHNKIDALVNDLCKLTSDSARSEAMAAYVTAISKFHKYSFFNAWMIVHHNPNATCVAGYRAWNKFNRYVRRGEHGIPIFAPIIIKDDEGNSKMVGCRVVYVFDISQTEGEPLPEAPDWNSPFMLAEIHDALIEFAASKNITVEIGELREGVKGCSKGGKIVLTPESGTTTLVHEIAHELLHQDRSKRNPSTQIMEIQAESIAYVVCSYFGMSNTHSPNYLALWDAEPKTIKQNLATIQQVACQIISFVHPEQPKPEE